MFELLSIKNFQRHKRIDVPLSQITTIIGETESGKSSIFRALRWLCLNLPRGVSFKRIGASAGTEVTLIADGIEVDRLRGKTNEYRLEGESYVAFGKGVPDAISKLLAVDSVNFQGQLDQPYWLTESPGQVARNLNAIVDLDIVDASLTDVGKESRKAKAEVVFIKSRLTEAKAEMKRLAFVRDLKGAYDDLCRSYDDWQDVEAEADDLAELIDNVVDRASEAKASAKEWNALSAVVASGEVWLAVSEESMRLSDLIDKISGCATKFAVSIEAADQIEKKMHKSLKGKECPLCHSMIV